MLGTATEVEKTPEQREDERWAQAEEAAHRRLEEWAHNLHYPGFETWCASKFPSKHLFEKLRTDRRNAAPGAHGSPFDIVDGEPCRPDGGLAMKIHRAVLRMSIALQIMNNCREVQKWFEDLPEECQRLVTAGYVRYSPREDAPTAEQAAVRCGLSRATYYRHRKLVLRNLACHLCLPT